MKKKFMFLVLAFAFLALPTLVVAADAERDILFFVQSHQNTAEATCVVYGRYCVLGIRTKGIILKSDRDRYIAEIEEGAKKAAPDIQTVYITTNLHETIMIKEVRKKLDEGKSIVEIYRYLENKYPRQLDRILSRDYNADR